MGLLLWPADSASSRRPPKPIKKRPSSMDVITPFSRCVHSYPIPPRQQGVPHGNPLSQPLFRALRPQSTSINHSISMGSRAQQGGDTDSRSAECETPISTPGSPGKVEQFCAFGGRRGSPCQLPFSGIAGLSRSAIAPFPQPVRQSVQDVSPTLAGRPVSAIGSS